MVTLVLLPVGERHSDAHAAARLDALYGAVNSDRIVEAETRRETRPDPESVRRFDEQTVGAYVAGAAAKKRGAPFLRRRIQKAELERCAPLPRLTTSR